MKTSKTILITGLLAITLTLSGCALLDGLFLDKTPILTGDGAPLYIDDSGTLTEERIDPKTGKEREQAYQYTKGAGTSVAQGLASSFGPWGAAVGAGLGLIGSAYAAIRNKRKFNGAAAALRFTMGTIEELKSRADADKDGKVTIEEIKNYVRTRGREDVKNPETYAALVKIAESAVTEGQALKDMAKVL